MNLPIAIIASGSGSNAQAIFDKINQGHLDAEVKLVICNRPGAKVLERAQKYRVPTLELDHTTYINREAFDTALVQALKSHDVELVVLAGYMRMITSVLLDAYPNKIINIHPALLPSFPGIHGARDAVSWGVKISGCTVHFVDEEMDHGAVIAQAAVPALAGETAQDLQQRIHGAEHRIFPQAIQWFADKRVQIIDRAVHIDQCGVRYAAPSANMHSEEACFFWPPLEEGF